MKHLHKKAYYIINGITWYRVITAPILLILLFYDRIDIFKWMLPISFFTDAIDGYLARKYKVTSSFGSRLDSLGDDMTVLVGLAGIFIWKPGFIATHQSILWILLGLFIIQLGFSLSKFGRPTSFHTYLAKIAAVCQGIFLILFFFIPEMPVGFFYAVAAITAIELIEETIMVLLIREWKTDVKGLFWLPREKK